jgi:hypothetical protein
MGKGKSMVRDITTRNTGGEHTAREKKGKEPVYVRGERKREGLKIIDDGIGIDLPDGIFKKAILRKTRVFLFLIIR